VVFQFGIPSFSFACRSFLLSAVKAGHYSLPVPVLMFGKWVFLFGFHKFSLVAFRAGHSHGFSIKHLTFLFGSRGTGVTFAMLLSMLSWRAGRPAGFASSSRQVSNSSIKATTVEELASYQASMSVAPYFGC
jgi:hypothetical protein